MSGEERAIRRSAGARDARDARGRPARLGVRPAACCSRTRSLSALGWVCGGAQAVVEALLDALGPEGTLVVPTHTSGNSDPAEWRHPPVPEALVAVIREHMPPYDLDVTPARGLGAGRGGRARHGRARVRSAHPQYSFAAIGPRAEAVTAGHALDSGFGRALAARAGRRPRRRRAAAGASATARTRRCTSRSTACPDPPRERVRRRGERPGRAGAGSPGRTSSTDEADFAELGAASTRPGRADRPRRRRARRG